MSINAIAHLKSLSDYSPSRKHDAVHLKNESADAYDLRTWREHTHCDPRDGTLYIPRICFKLALIEAAKLAKDPIPGKGKQEWGTLFVSGVHAMTDVKLPLKKTDLLDDKHMEAVSSNSNGRPGVGSRVIRRFPMIRGWSADVTFLITNPNITEPAFKKYLESSGLLIGIGRWRPANRGSNGMFEVTKIKWDA